jgi:hypothetical protein
LQSPRFVDLQPRVTDWQEHGAAGQTPARPRCYGARLSRPCASCNEGTLPMPVEDRVASDEIAWQERQDYRDRFWRLALGALGLFWVGVLILLMP